jgi:hypothetical protein
MGQFLQTNGDYNIKTREGGTVRVDTGPGVGELRVTGNLVVEGDTVTVSAENLQVQDNIITVNFGETGAGVTLRYSGIEVDRGTENNVSLVWDESDDTWNFLENGTSYISSRLRLKEILTNTDTDNGDLSFDVGNAGVLKVINSAGTYQLRVTDDDDIPNKAYVDNAIQTNPTFQILRGNTRVSAFDIDDPIDSELFPIGPYFVQPLTSLVSVVIDDQIVAEFSPGSAKISNLLFFNEDPTPDDPLIPDAVVLQTLNTNANIKLETNGTGKVQVTYALQLDNHGLIPAATTVGSLLFGGDVGTGGSGAYYSNDSGNDELVGKRKAILYGMIF